MIFPGAACPLDAKSPSVRRRRNKLDENAAESLPRGRPFGLSGELESESRNGNPGLEVIKTVRQWERAEIHQSPGQSQSPIDRGWIYGCNRTRVITFKMPLHRPKCGFAAELVVIEQIVHSFFTPSKRECKSTQ